MKVEILSMEYSDDSAAKGLIGGLNQAFEEREGYIFYKFPVIKEMDEELVRPDVFFISPGLGIYMIFCGEGKSENSSGYEELCEAAERADSYVFSALIKQKNLQLNKRQLKFGIETLKYMPYMDHSNDEDAMFHSVEELCDYICDGEQENQGLDQEGMMEVIAHLEAATATIKPKERIVDRNDTTSKAAILKHIESQIAKFDDRQRLAALALMNGPQRIRGLAGSGKTIILCLKAAYLHLEYPEKTIIYTFYTKSLYEYIHQLITRFYLKISDGQLPDFENGILIMHAWGGKNVPGVYYRACIENHVTPLTYSSVPWALNRFEVVCDDFIEKTKYRARKNYEYIIMDEAQDFPASFYQLCRSIVVDDHLIWGYDELQNIFNVYIQNTVDTFRNQYDNIGIDLRMLGKDAPVSNDVVLQKSYRNMKEILVTAISVGFGIYNNKLIQSLESNEHWRDFGFEVLAGDCSSEEDVIIERPDENSPLAIPEGMEHSDVIEFYSAEDSDEEIKYVCHSIVKAIREDSLRPDDIAVISLDDRYAGQYFGRLQSMLTGYGIATNNLLDKNYVKGFSLEDYVTLTSVYKAKGNEAAMVFVIGCDVFDDEKFSRNMRNKVFTAFTRAKVWLRISGIDLKRSALYKEIIDLQNHNYEFHFKNVYTYKLDEDWRENEKALEKKNEFANKLYQMMETMGMSEMEVASILREKGNYGSEKHE